MDLDTNHLNARIDVLNARLAWHNRVISHQIESDNFADLASLACAAQKTKTTRDSLVELVARIERKRNVSLPKVAA